MRKITTFFGCLLSFGLCMTSISASAATLNQTEQLPYMEIVKRSYEECLLDSFDIPFQNEILIDKQAAILSVKDAEEYYGSQLNANAKAFYDQIGQHIDETYDGHSPINIDCDNLTLTQSNWQEAFVRGADAYFADHPEVFWIDSGCLSASASKMSNSPYYTSVILMPQQTSYYLPAERTGNKQQFNGEASVIAAKAKLDIVANSCLSQIPENASDYEKLKIIHDWLANRIDYDLAYNDQGLYSAMLLERGVCAGYKDSFNYLARKAGIESISVSGFGYTSATRYENHAWNLVKLDGAWYGVDVTWDDQTEKETKKIYDDYFLVGSESVPKTFSYQVPFSVSHRVRNYLSDSRYSFQIPTLNQTAYENKSGTVTTQPPVTTAAPVPTQTPGTQPPAQTLTPGTQPPAAQTPGTTNMPDNSQPPVSENPPQIKAGDVNGDGDVSLEDASLALCLALGIPTENAIAEAADIDGKDGVTLEDAQIILKIALGIPT